jgi:hypothetical protein
MEKEEIEEIKSLLKGLAGISNFKSTGDRVDKMIVVLDNELSKLHQPTVSGWLSDEECTDCGCLEEVCKMIKGKCKNLAYR